MDFRHLYSFPDDYRFNRSVWLGYFNFADTVQKTVNDAKLTRRQMRKFRNQ